MNSSAIPMNDMASLIMLIPACLVLATSVVTQIRLYQVVSGMLALLTAWTAVSSSNWLILILVAIPIGMVVFVRPLLRYVAGTVAPTPTAVLDRTESLPVRHRMLYFAAGLMLTSLVVLLMAGTLPRGNGAGMVSLATAVSMLVIGVLSWMMRKDLLSQAIGLLIMDHGLFLAAESLISKGALASTLIVVLFVYLAVPLTCVLLVLPKLRQMPGGLQVDEHRDLRG